MLNILGNNGADIVMSFRLKRSGMEKSQRIILKGLDFFTALHFGRKERSDGIASKQMRLVRASMTITSQACKYIVTSTNAERSHRIEKNG